jgi:hypothetical protein
VVQLLAQKYCMGQGGQGNEVDTIIHEHLRTKLASYKFKDWVQTETKKIVVTAEMKSARAEEIAKSLSDITKWHSHSRGISRETLQSELNLKIDKLEANQDLAKSVAGYHDCLTDYLTQKSVGIWVQTRSHIF